MNTGPVRQRGDRGALALTACGSKGTQAPAQGPVTRSPSGASVSLTGKLARGHPGRAGSASKVNAKGGVQGRRQDPQARSVIPGRHLRSRTAAQLVDQFSDQGIKLIPRVPTARPTPRPRPAVIRAQQPGHGRHPPAPTTRSSPKGYKRTFAVLSPPAGMPPRSSRHWPISPREADLGRLPLRRRRLPRPRPTGASRRPKAAGFTVTGPELSSPTVRPTSAFGLNKVRGSAPDVIIGSVHLAGRRHRQQVRRLGLKPKAIGGPSHRRRQISSPPSAQQPTVSSGRTSGPRRSMAGRLLRRRVGL